MPLRRQMRSVISRARGSIFEIMAKHSLDVSFADHQWANQGYVVSGRAIRSLRLRSPSVTDLCRRGMEVLEGNTLTDRDGAWSHQHFQIYPWNVSNIFRHVVTLDAVSGRFLPGA